MAFYAFLTRGDQRLVAALRPIFSNRMLLYLKAQKLEARVFSVESVAAGCFLGVEFETDFMEPFLQSGLGAMDVSFSTG